MDSMLSGVSICNGCGAPLPEKPTLHHAIKCDYCELTNYLKHTASVSSHEESIPYDKELEAENYYLIFQEAQKVLENYPGELIGEEVGKLRIKLQIGAYGFPLLVVLDNLPDCPYIDGPTKLRELLSCEISDLKSMKEWSPGNSSIVDVLEEISQKASVNIPKVMGESGQEKASGSYQNETDPLIRQILKSYDASATNKEILLRFYAQNGEVINFIINRKRNYPINIESDILAKYPLMRGPLEDYSRGRIDLLTTLSEIEKVLYI